MLCEKIWWNVGAFEPHFATTAYYILGACGTLGMMLYSMKMLWNYGVSKPHSKFKSKFYVHVSLQPFHGSSPLAVNVHPQAPCNQTYPTLTIINISDWIFFLTFKFKFHAPNLLFTLLNLAIYIWFTYPAYLIS